MTAYMKYGRRLTRKQRAACWIEGIKRARGLEYRASGRLARSFGCHRDTILYWMNKDPGVRRPPGPRPGRVRRPLTDLQKARAREYRAAGAAVPVLAKALSEDFPEGRVTIHQVARLKREEKWEDLNPRSPKPKAKPFDKTAPGFIHIDTIIGPNTTDPVVFTARERSSRFVFARVSRARGSDAAAGFLKNIVSRFPLKVHTILTDNGSEFKKHFAAEAANLGLVHKHTRARHPQTNGMVERFNGLLKTAVDAHDGSWWYRGNDSPTDRDKLHHERFGTPLPDRKVFRMQADLDRWLLWMNVIRPNRQIAWQAPLAWLQGLESVLPASFLRPTCTIISPSTLQRISAGLRGHRYLLVPPENWVQTAGVTTDL